MLKLEHVYKYYNNRGVTTKGLDDICVTFNTGEIVAITGESGSGKSTLLNVISRLDTFDDGEIYFKGNETSYFNVLDMDQFRKNKISFIFQNYNIIDSYTVLENVMLPLLINGENKAEAKKKALEILDKVGLTGRASNRGINLSGGEKQRTVIARALALDTPIIACDEPTGNLDAKSGREIMELIASLSKDKLILIVTHNFEEVKDLVTRKIKIHDGKIVEDIKFKETLDDPDEELNLDYVPISRKVDFKVATSNLLSTPKKTIFTFLVLLVVAFFSLCIFQNIASSAKSTGSDYKFVYHSDNKYQVYDENYKALDINKLKEVGDVVINPFYEKNYITLRQTGDVDFFSSGSLDAIYEPNVDGKIKEGREPEKEDEFVLFLPSETTGIKVGNTYCLSAVYKTSTSDSYSHINKTLKDSEFTLCGIGYSDNVSSPVITKCDKLEEYSRFTVATNMELSSNGIDIKGTHLFFNFEDVTHIANYNKTTALDFNNIYLKYYNYNLFSISSLPQGLGEEKEYQALSDNSYTTCYNAIVIGYDYYDYFTDVYEASVYVSKKSDIKKLDELGYQYYSSNIASGNTTFIDDFVIYVTIASSTILILILYFISYIILRKIYETKSESYTIFRTLGVNIADMKKISLYEVLLLSIISTTLNYIVFTILGKIFKYNIFLKTFRNISFGITLAYFVCTILMAVLIAIRFNKKLFKKSVKESLKEAK